MASNASDSPTDTFPAFSIGCGFTILSAALVIGGLLFIGLR